MMVMAAIVIWVAGCWLVPILVKPFEAGYGVVTLAALTVWTLLSMGIIIYNVST